MSVYSENPNMPDSWDDPSEHRSSLAPAAGSVICTAAQPKPSARVHPDAKCDRSSFDGADDHYVCPHCNASWWVEYDG
jgi:hypothetical protein